MAKKTNFKYVCGWCKHQFEQVIAYSEKATDQVQCPKCKNFLETDSGK